MEKINIAEENVNSMGFLPDGDLIIISLNHEDFKLKDCQVYCYSIKNKPTRNTAVWKCSQIYDIEFTKISSFDIFSFVYQTKLFCLWKKEQLMFQWDLLKMTFDVQYFIDDVELRHDLLNIVTNKHQTLLALGSQYKIDIFLMETGQLISRYG